MLELIGRPESHLARAEQEKDITESRKSIALEGGRKGEKERDSIGKVSDGRETRSGDECDSWHASRPVRVTVLYEHFRYWSVG